MFSLASQSRSRAALTILNHTLIHSGNFFVLAIDPLPKQPIGSAPICPRYLRRGKDTSTIFSDAQAEQGKRICRSSATATCHNWNDLIACGNGGKKTRTYRSLYFRVRYLFQPKLSVFYISKDPKHQ